MLHRRVGLATLISASLLAALATAASARVTATDEGGGELWIRGTLVHDEIVVNKSGPNFVIDDKDRVNARTGCSQSGDVAVCPASRFSEIRVIADQSDDLVTIAANVGLPTQVDGNGGNDTINLFNTPTEGHFNTGLGGDGDDRISGGPGRDDLHGFAGNDTINGSNGDDILTGESGNDTLQGSFGNDVLAGDEGADSLRGDNGVDEARYRFRDTGITVILGGGTGTGTGTASDGDTIQSVEDVTGTEHNDTLVGDNDANKLTGLGGNDALDGRGGADVLLPGVGLGNFFGGPGTDTLSYEDLDVGVIAAIGTAGNGTNADRSQGGATIADDIENITGSKQPDVLTGNAGANVINGGLGGDTLRGNSGPDVDAGDTFTGALGFDTVAYDNRGQSVTVDADGNADDGASGPPALSEGDNVGIDVEALTGGAGDDTLKGRAQLATLTTVMIDDTVIDHVANVLRGGGGNDNLVGTADNDVLFGGAGFDQHQGLEGDDGIDASGDAVADAVSCGAGADVAKLDLVDQQSGCESIAQAPVGRHPTVVIRPAPRLKGRTLPVTLACPGALPAPCAGRLEVEVRSGKPLAARSYSVAPGKRAGVKLTLSASEARHVGAAIRVRLISRELDAEGRPKTKIVSARVKPARQPRLRPR